MFVQSTRHQFFARARFAGDHHRHIALRQTANGAKHVLHGRCLAQHLGRGGHLYFGHFFTLAFFHRAANQLHRLGQIKGLRQILKCTVLESGNRAVQVRERRHDDDRQAWQALLDGSEQIQARAAGHADVADQGLWAVPIVQTVQRLQDLARVGETARGQAFTQQCFLKHEANGLVIIYDPDRLHGRTCFLKGVRATGSEF